MTAYTIRNEETREFVIDHIKTRSLPMTIHVEKGAKRSTEQERTHRMWMRELEEQGDMTAEEYRGYNKLFFGVRLMKYQSDLWAEKYDKIMKPLDHEIKLEFLMEPMSYPLTSLMTTKTFTQYLNDVYQYWTGRRLDEDKTMTETGLKHYNGINRLRAQNGGITYMLTLPKKDS